MKYFRARVTRSNEILTEFVLLANNCIENHSVRATGEVIGGLFERHETVSESLQLVCPKISLQMGYTLDSVGFKYYGGN